MIDKIKVAEFQFVERLFFVKSQSLIKIFC
jgi:hypothetical protein